MLTINELLQLVDSTLYTKLHITVSNRVAADRIIEQLRKHNLKDIDIVITSRDKIKPTTK